MKVDNDMQPDGSKDYYNTQFRYTLEAHMPHLRTSLKSYLADVLPINTVIYNQDLFGLLNQMRILPCFHWVIMRLNHLTSPFDFTRETTTLLIPNTGELEIIRQSWNATTIIHN